MKSHIDCRHCKDTGWYYVRNPFIEGDVVPEMCEHCDVIDNWLQSKAIERNINNPAQSNQAKEAMKGELNDRSISKNN